LPDERIAFSNRYSSVSLLRWSRGTEEKDKITRSAGQHTLLVFREGRRLTGSQISAAGWAHGHLRIMGEMRDRCITVAAVVEELAAMGWAS